MRGFYKGIRFVFIVGLFANLIGIAPEKAIKLAVNDYAREYWAKRLGIVQEQLHFS